MKNLMLITLLASLFSGMAIAAETDTICPYMRESNSRENNKLNMSANIQKTTKKFGSRKIK